MRIQRRLGVFSSFTLLVTIYLLTLHTPTTWVWARPSLASAAAAATADVDTTASSSSPSVSSFFLPFNQPHSYQPGELLDMRMIKLESVRTQVPFPYYSLPFCSPATTAQQGGGLGSILAGDMSEPALYSLHAGINVDCQVLCVQDFSIEQMDAFAERIADDYVIKSTVDDLPVGSKFFAIDSSSEDEVVAAAAAAAAAKADAAGAADKVGGGGGGATAAAASGRTGSFTRAGSIVGGAGIHSDDAKKEQGAKRALLATKTSSKDDEKKTSGEKKEDTTSAEEEIRAGDANNRLTVSTPVLVERLSKAFALGFIGTSRIPQSEPNALYLNNHMRFTVYVHEDSAEFTGLRVVGVEVLPMSIKHQLEDPAAWPFPRSDALDQPAQSVRDPSSPQFQREQQLKLRTCSASSPVTRDAVPMRVAPLRYRHALPTTALTQHGTYEAMLLVNAANAHRNNTLATATTTTTTSTVDPAILAAVRRSAPDMHQLDAHDIALSAVRALDERRVIFTYDVHFERTNVPWSRRWEAYTSVPTATARVHWFSLLDSTIVVLFLSGVCAAIMVRVLRRDLAQYNLLDTTGAVFDEEAALLDAEETGWKLVSGDVFRPPPHSTLLSILAGTGVQLLLTAAVTLLFASIGLLSPSQSGSVLTSLLMLFVFFGAFGGYASAVLYRMFGGKRWVQHALVTAVFFPGAVFTLFFVLNLFLWHQASSAAVPFTIMIAICSLWLCVTLPLTFIGAWLAFHAHSALVSPVRVNSIPRTIAQVTMYGVSVVEMDGSVPSSPKAASSLSSSSSSSSSSNTQPRMTLQSVLLYLLSSPVFALLLGGSLPFSAVFIELFYIMSSLWLNQPYVIFGVLALVFCVLLVTCAGISIVLCYFQLCAEDYRWWWRSFFTSGSSAFYLLAYSLLYLVTKLHFDHPLAYTLYLGYMLLIALGFFVLTGTIGFLASLWFVRTIYASVKID